MLRVFFYENEENKGWRCDDHGNGTSFAYSCRPSFVFDKIYLAECACEGEVTEKRSAQEKLTENRIIGIIEKEPIHRWNTL